MAQDQAAQEQDEQNSQSTTSNTDKKKQEKDHTPCKIVIRRLPPSLTPEQFLEQVSPLPDYDFFYFVRADMSLGPQAFSRAYINFLSANDIFVFRDKFDGYVFLDAKGGEYPALVEFSPFQKVPKKKPKKVDAKNGIIEQDADYKKFLEVLSNPAEITPVSLDAMVGEVEAKETSNAKPGVSHMTTPLLDYLRRRREERKLNIAKLKEERRHGGSGRDRDRDGKRGGHAQSTSYREESDRERRRPLSDKDKLRDRDRRRDRNRDRDRPREKDFKDGRRKDGPERRQKDEKEGGGSKKWSKEEDTPPRQTVMLLKNPDREHLNKARDGVTESEESIELKQAEGNSFRDRRGGGEKWREDDRDRRKGRGRGFEDGRGYKEKPKRDAAGKGGGRNFHEEGSSDKRYHEKDRIRYRDERGGGDRPGDKDRGGRKGGRYREEEGRGGKFSEDRKEGGGGDFLDRQASERGGGANFKDRRDERKESGASDKRGGGRGAGGGAYDRENRRGGGAGGGAYDRENRRGGGAGGGTYDRENRRGGAAGEKDGKRSRGGGRGGYDNEGRHGVRDDRPGNDGAEGFKRRGDSDTDKRRFDKDRKVDGAGGKGRTKEDAVNRSKISPKAEASKDERPTREDNSDSPSKESSKGKQEGPDRGCRPTRSETEVSEEKVGGADDKKRKRKDRPERQIYIPRRALERQKDGSRSGSATGSTDANQDQA